ncbi:Enoyl-CoA delta isomerase 2, mitochondrial [Hondaea fermentalgiana]|uniref:Enoyl-CoA delta isomerase 2, mitochondrial n=1 Tax=Hondaea fermentalgiana TaxID=2315210 RepID=A0A2R5GNY0_9STRA|nr:Enoyl-CoA delta isomerase 2, mitochondrial [Hondaea fermentalgiana]|eukprot:GBG30011.1 Enoyl-CoA delta isomerase 2, mitochondrial [Hondaea fermentalgiana]
MATEQKEEVLLQSDCNGVRTLTFNRPAKLNGWSPDLVQAFQEGLEQAAKDDTVKACILTGAGKYYCAGVDFAGSLKPMHPRDLLAAITEQNEALFAPFIDFPKPLFIAANGPAIGASVTSAFIADGIVAAESASFLTPFKSLGLVPEGCSSYTFPQAFGETTAREILEGRKLSAQDALELGYCQYVVPQDQVLAKTQELAEEWIASGRTRKIIENGSQAKLREVNKVESVALANAMLGLPFLNHMVNFSYEKSKYGPFLVFWLARTTRPLWSRL